MRREKNRNWLLIILVSSLGLALLAVLLYQLPPVRERLDWRRQVAQAYLRGILYPAGPVPTSASSAGLETTQDILMPTHTASATPTPVPTLTTPQPTPTLIPSPTAIPPAVALSAPYWEKQGPNDCGPASLSIYLHYYGWEGDQKDINELIKPLSADRNVNPDELVYFVRTRAGWLRSDFRVGGDIDLLKKLVAAGFPVMIEESFYFDAPFWPNDDLWAAHYLLITGYDDATETFTVQDSFHGPNRQIAYEDLDKEWKIFNRVYLLIYPPEQEETLKAILGSHWDVNLNRQHALEVARSEIQTNPDDAFAWFNLGSNLVYFDDYTEAVTAFDNARNLGLPQRMLRYQFSPFFAYFHTGKIDELLTLTNYALQRTDNSEEALLWNGWALYRQGDTTGAISDWRKALKARPDYQDALYALDFVGSTP